MKDYIKPTFILAGLAPVALAVMNCELKLKGADLEDLYKKMGYTADEVSGKTFAYGENCEYPVPSEFCKFTSSAETTGQALTS